MVTAISINDRFDNFTDQSDQTFANQGRVYFDAKSYSAAWYCFNEAIKRNPNEQHHYYMRGACSGNLGNYQAAFVDYNKALSSGKLHEEMI